MFAHVLLEQLNVNDSCLDWIKVYWNYQVSGFNIHKHCCSLVCGIFVEYLWIIHSNIKQQTVEVHPSELVQCGAQYERQLS